MSRANTIGNFQEKNKNCQVSGNERPQKGYEINTGAREELADSTNFLWETEDFDNIVWIFRHMFQYLLINAGKYRNNAGIS